MEPLNIPILATFHGAAAISPVLMTILALTALAVGLMGLLALSDGQRVGERVENRAKQPAEDFVPVRHLIALPEPALRSMIERRATAPSRAPPSGRHLIRLTALPCPGSDALSIPRGCARIE
jgi:hypothetical protein